MDQKNNQQTNIEFEPVYITGFTSSIETNINYTEKDGQCIESDGFDLDIQFESSVQQNEESITSSDSRTTVQSPVNEGDKNKEGVNSEPAAKNETSRAERLNNEKPATEETIQENTHKSTLDHVENRIGSINENTQKGVQSLKSDLEDYTQDGGSWFVAGLAGTALDIMGGTSALTAGYSKGMLDTRNIGEGMAKGTADGVMEDLSRLSNILPQGKILSAIDRVVAGYELVNNIKQGDYTTASAMGGIGAITHLSTIAGVKKRRNRLGTDPPPKGELIGKLKGSRVGEKTSEFDSGEIGAMVHPDGDFRPQNRLKSPLKGQPTKYTQPDYYSEKYKILIENKQRTGWFSKKSRQETKYQAGGRLIHTHHLENPKQWLVVDHRGYLTGKSVNEIHKKYWKEFGGNSIYERIFMVTNDGVFMFFKQ